jgi:hypothetical protein
MHYRAKVQAGSAPVLRDCVLVDVSVNGARLMVDRPGDLPEDFTLLLSHRGTPQRRCHVAWRSPREVGVNFDFGRPPSRSA